MTVVPVPQQWPADQVVRRRVADLKPFPGNPKIHTDEQVDEIAALIERFGWWAPVVVDEVETILAGHGRAKAALKKGWDTVPSVQLLGLSADDKLAIVLADNKVGENATYDNVLLRGHLQRLQSSGYNLDLTGYRGVSLASFLSAPSARGRGLGSLVDQFGVPPFTVFSARMGYWQERKRAWLGLGIQSELGRGEAAKPAPLPPPPPQAPAAERRPDPDF